MKRSQLSEQYGGQRFKDRYDVVGKAATGENSVVYVGGVSTGCELTLSGRVKRASLTTLCEWLVSAWAVLSRELVMCSFAKWGISLEDDVLWNSSSDNGNTDSTTSEDESSSD